MNTPTILMYSRVTCPYCVAARNLLKSKQLEWQEISIDAEPDRRDEMIEKSGRKTVPQVFIGSIHVGGFDDLNAANQSGQLDQWLGR
ncbi:MAG: glutaredoxin 3 [Pseudomonadota bacterium]